jgi:hypothetical protein
MALSMQATEAPKPESLKGESAESGSLGQWQSA